MLFPLSYELSLVGVIYLRLEKGCSAREAAGELRTAPGTVAASCPCALRQSLAAILGSVRGALPGRRRGRVPLRDVVLRSLQHPAPSLSSLMLSSAPASLLAATPGLVALLPSTQGMGTCQAPAAGCACSWSWAPALGKCQSESQGHRSPNQTALQSMACRFTSAQMETELSRSLSPRPARRQYLN